LDDLPALLELGDELREQVLPVEGGTRTRGGTMASGGCLDGAPTTAFFAHAKALARAVGVPVPLPAHAPPTAKYVRFCVYPLPKTATDTTPGTGEPTLNFYRVGPPRLSPLLGASLGPLKVGTTIASVLAQHPARKLLHKTVHLGVYTAVHVYAKPDPGRTFPCLNSEWYFRAAGLLWVVEDYGKCGVAAAAFIASLRPAY